MQHQAEDFLERQGLQHVIETRQAGRQLVCRNILQPHLPTGRASANQCCQPRQPGIATLTTTTRRMYGSQQADHAENNHADPLDDAQRTRLLTEYMLQIERAAHDGDASEKGKQE